MKAYKQFINGTWVESQSGNTDEVRSPSTGELVGTIQGGDIVQSDNENEHIWIHKIPRGVVVALTAWNFPFYVNYA